MENHILYMAMCQDFEIAGSAHKQQLRQRCGARVRGQNREHPLTGHFTRRYVPARLSQKSRAEY
jgi:hypothetical protein